MSLLDQIGGAIAGRYEGRGPDEAKVLRDLGLTLVWTCFVIVTAAISVLQLAVGHPWRQACALIGMCGLVSLAAAAVGGILGFLFGVPQTLADGAAKPAPAAGAPTVTRYVRSNTNLEQVSDWLTKIVLGATLVEIKELFGGLLDLGARLEQLSQPLIGGDIKGVGGVLSVLIALFFAVGFLTLYLQTRTFLAIMFARTELVMNDPKLGAGEIDKLRSSASEVAAKGPAAVIDPAVKALAQRALGEQPVDPDDAAALRQHGFAQVVLGRIDEGATTLKRALELSPAPDPDLMRMTSRLLARSSRPGEAKDMLRDALRPGAGPLTDSDVDILLTKMFASLYEHEPGGFEEALRIGASLEGLPSVQGSQKRAGRLALYMTAAHGQRHGYEKRRGAPEDILSEIRQTAYRWLNRALVADPDTNRPILKNMLHGVGADNDLISFQADQGVTDLIEGRTPPNPDIAY